jgi:protein O-GlcNAc transferase
MKKNTSNLYQKAVFNHQKAQWLDAIATCNQILLINPAHVDAIKIKVSAYWAQREWGGAEKEIRRLLEIKPASLEFLGMYADFLRAMGRGIEAESVYQKILKISPGNEKALCSMGRLLAERGSTEMAIQYFSKCIEVNPGNVDAMSAMAQICRQRNDLAASREILDAALAINPSHLESCYGMAVISEEESRWRDAMQFAERVLKNNINYQGALGILINAQSRLCNWSNWSQIHANFSAIMRAGVCPISPFVCLGFLDDPAIQKRVAENFFETTVKKAALQWGAATEKCNNSPDPFIRRKIRIAYISPDFRDHPVSHLIADTIEGHDRETFEVYAVHLSSVCDKWTDRIERACDHFIKVDGLPPPLISARLRALGIDVAIDLAGYTHQAKPEIFAIGVAPVQIHYIGHLGTLSSPCVNYILADAVTIPPEYELYYTEKVMRLSHCFQPVAIRRPDDNTPTKESCNLPSDHFVFCCFNNSYKIKPDIFSAWMSILFQVPRSVLWLYASDIDTENNLKKKATECGVDPDRIVFASRVPLEHYLARYRLADIFLDTPVYNAGTTAGDALWMGVPVVTLPGKGFAARQGASIAQAAGIPDLVAKGIEDYVHKAVTLARNPEILQYHRQSITRDKPFFRMEDYLRDLEAVYVQLFDSNKKQV